MKKFFGILLAAVSALVLLPGCGGGGDNDPTRITLEEFQNGAKYFELRGGFAGHLIIKSTEIAPGYDDDTADPELTDDIVFSSAKSTTVDGLIGIGVADTQAGYTYTCYYDENGVVQMGKIVISTVFNAAGNNDLVEFFNAAVPEGEEVDVRGEVAVIVDFNNNSFYVEGMEIQDPNNPDDDRPISGTVVVRR